MICEGKFINMYIRSIILFEHNIQAQNIINGSFIRYHFQWFQPPFDRGKPLSPDVPFDSGLGTSWTSVQRSLFCKGVWVVNIFQHGGEGWQNIPDSHDTGRRGKPHGHCGGSADGSTEASEEGISYHVRTKFRKRVFHMLLANIACTSASVQWPFLLGHDTTVVDAISKAGFSCNSDPLPEFADALERVPLWMMNHINTPDKT